jgi:hypothetical protein
LATLNLQQELNKKVFDANVLYKRTGVVPTEITDYRSTSEKLADIVNLRILIRAQLRQIADAQNAEDIAQSLSADQLVFLSQNIDAIIRDLRPKNKFGVLKDIFMKYLENYMMKEQGNQLGLVGLPDTTRPFRSAPEVPLDRQTKRLAGFLGEVQQFIESVRTERNKSIIAMISQGLNAINYLNATDLQFPLSLSDPTVRSQVEMLLDQARDPIPNLTDIEEALQHMKENVGDPTYLDELLAQLAGRLTFDPSFFELRNQAEQILTRSLNQEKSGFTPTTEQELYDEIEDERQTDVPTTVNSSIVSRTDPADWLLSNPLPSLFVKPTDEANLEYYKDFGLIGRQSKSGQTLKDLRDLISPYKRARVIDVPLPADAPGLKIILTKYYPTMKRAYLTQQARLAEATDDGRASSTEPPSVSKAGWGGAEAPKILFKETRRSGDEGSVSSASYASGSEGGYSSGEGFRRKLKGRGIAKGVDYAKGIDPLPKYAPIGNYYINLQKLKDDIITCCRPSGKNLNTWKSRRVSLPLANVIRKLVNKGKPSFDEMSELSEEDKHILGDFIRKAKLEVDIPNSKIDREDLNQFEIMKGEIMAGNDSKELIKKFKLLIVKLSQQDRLPKGQAKEILMDLAQIGY